MPARHNPRHVLGGFEGLMPHPPRPRRGLPGLRHGSTQLQFRCRILGQDVWVVDGDRVRLHDPGFGDFATGVSAPYVPKREVWLDAAIERRSWLGYTAAWAVLEALLQQVRHWSPERSSSAGALLAADLRDVGRRYGSEALHGPDAVLVWKLHLEQCMPGMPDSAEFAAQAVRQSWRYL